MKGMLSFPYIVTNHPARLTKCVLPPKNERNCLQMSFFSLLRIRRNQVAKITHFSR